MIRQFTLRPAQAATHAPRKSRNWWFKAVLAAITGTASGVVALPVLIPALTGASSGLTFETVSHVSRASAFVAYVLIWMSMLAGLSITSKAARRARGMSWSFGLHRYTSLLGLGFALVHVLVLLSDKYMNYTLGQLLLPFMSGGYKPHWLGLGQVAFYLMAIITASFYFRGRLGMRAWRMIHGLSFALFLMALIHGMQSGSDSSSWWASGLYWVSAASVVFGSLWRVMQARSGHRKEAVAATGLVILGGRSQA